MICENCLYKLESFWEFRDRAARTENLLVDLYKQLHVVGNKIQNNQQQQIVKMDIVAMPHPELVMVQTHHDLLNHQHAIPNVNDLDLTALSHRDNIIVGQEIILSHQDINAHPLSNINLNHHNLTSHDLSNHSLQAQNTLLVDSSGSVHAMSNVRYADTNLELIRDEQHMYPEPYTNRLQQRLEIDMTNQAAAITEQTAMQLVVKVMLPRIRCFSSFLSLF